MSKSSTAMLATLALLVPGGAAMAALEDLPHFTPDANIERSAVPEVFRWQLDALVADLETWEQQLEAARREVAALAALRDPGDVDRLVAYLEAFFNADRRVNRLTLHANLARETAQTDAAAIARHQRALALTGDLMAEGPHLRRAILGLDGETLATWRAASPELEAFGPFVDSLRRRFGAVLDADAERVLALAGDNLWAQIDLNELPSHSESAFVALISELPLPRIVGEDGQEVQLTFANFGRLRASADREVRRRAVEAMFTTLKRFENTFAATLAGQASFDVFLARARRYDTALEAYLDKDDIDPAVYRNLVATVREHAGALHRYVELRRRVMGLETVHLYDLYVPLVEGVDREMSYAEGAQAIVDALAPLGSEYGAVLRTAIDPANGWVDVYPHRDKGSGAFSASAYGVRPFVKMNFQNRFNDVSTLAHELGHALHSHLSMESQPYVSWRYVPFLAEVASTCNEVLLSRYMTERATSDAERAWLLTELAESIRTTIYRQALFAQFELAFHELVESGQPVTAERLNEIYIGLVREFYGPAYTVDDHDAVEWAYIPHFYWKYYVFTYATGLASGVALAEGMLEGGDAERAAYLEMLRAGSSAPPLELLRRAGVDLTRPEPIAAALELFAATVSRLEELLAPPPDAAASP